MSIPGEPAMHHTILAVDVARFSAPERSNQHRLVVRSALYEALEEALAASGVRWRACHRTDLGDGVLILAPATCPKAVLGGLVPGALASRLSVHNSTHEPPERIRLRLAIHAGEVTRDAHGVTGSAIVHAFRLLDSAAVKDALASSEGDLAVITSNWFYEEVIRHSPLTDPRSYRPVVATVKETTAPAWIHLPTPERPLATATGGAGRELG
ncbi:hypothetical protein [Amycolatopsis sp. cmx-4-68]|uniref:hypothetical protein n=1 Tax=Amycolatopsis sp. cmx-4-68 TaxID=2790938 RepID=UPI00397CFA94